MKVDQIISIISLNTQGLRNLYSVESTLKKYNIILIQEASTSMTKFSKTLKEIKNGISNRFPHYNIHLNLKGNLCILCKKGIQIIHIIDGERFQRILIGYHAQQIEIYNIHLNPEEKLKKQNLGTLKRCLQKNQGHPTILIGDFNMCLTKHDTDAQSRIDIPKFKSFQQENDLVDIFRSFHGNIYARTCFTNLSNPSRVDYALANNKAIDIINWCDIDYNLCPGDHCAIKLFLRIHGHCVWQRLKHPVRYKLPEKDSVFPVKTKEIYSKSILKLNECESIQDLNSIYDEFEKNFKKCMEDTLPKCSFLPFFTSNRKLDKITKQILQAKQILHKISWCKIKHVPIQNTQLIIRFCWKHQIPLNNSSQTVKYIKKFLQEKNQNYKMLLKDTLKNQRDEKWSNARTSFCSPNQNSWFQIMKRRINPPQDHEDFMQKSEKSFVPLENLINTELKSKWANLFSSNNTYNYDKMKNLVESFMPNCIEQNHTLTQEFTIEEIELLLQGKSYNKAPGHDHITYELMRLSHRESCIEFLIKLFNMCLKLQDIPLSWKKGQIVLVPKNAENTEFRPISLLSVFYKSFTQLLNTRLKNFCNSQKLISPEQIGFQGECREHIVLLQETIHQSQITMEKGYLIFADFAKAYDSIDRRTIELVLSHCTNNPFTKLILNCLEGSTSTILNRQGESDPFPIQRGVKQGDVISPLLFNLSIEPIIRCLKENLSHNCLSLLKKTGSPLLAYADDIVIGVNSEQAAHTACKYLQYLCEISGMKMNMGPTKTAAMPIGISGPPRKPFKINNQVVHQLDKKSSYPYLGFHILPDGSTQTHILSRYKKSLESMQRLRHTPIDIFQMTKAVQVFIRPKLSYCLELCGKRNNPCIKGRPFWKTIGENERGIINSSMPNALRIHKTLIHGSRGKDELGLGFPSLLNFLAKKLLVFWIKICKQKLFITQYTDTLIKKGSWFRECLDSMLKGCPVVLMNDNAVPVQGVNVSNLSHTPLLCKNDVDIHLSDWCTNEEKSKSTVSITQFTELIDSIQKDKKIPSLNWYQKYIGISSKVANFIFAMRFKRLPTLQNISNHSSKSSPSDCPLCHTNDHISHFLHCPIIFQKYKLLIPQLIPEISKDPPDGSYSLGFLPVSYNHSQNIICLDHSSEAKNNTYKICCGLYDTELKKYFTQWNIPNSTKEQITFALGKIISFNYKIWIIRNRLINNEPLTDLLPLKNH